MRILRMAAGVVFILWALAALGAGWMAAWWMKRMAPELGRLAHQLDFWQAFLVLAGLNLWAAWQMLRGPGRWLAWCQAVISVVATYRLGWPLLITAIPLVYLVLEAAIPLRESSEARRRAGTGSIEGVLGVAGLIGSYWLFSRLPGLHPPENMDDGWLVWVAYTWVAILIHEAGHALGGRAMGFTLVEFCVTPFVYSRQSGHHRVRWRWTAGGHYLGFPAGQAAADWRGHWMMVAAGPGANLVTFLLTWPLLVWAGARLGPVGYGFTYGLMKWSLFGAVLNLIPMKAGSFRTDGRYLWDAFFVPEDAKLNLAMASTMASRGTALRPRQWPRAWVEAMRPRIADDESAAALMSLWAQDRLLEDAQDPAAWHLLADCVAALDEHAQQLDGEQAKAYRMHAAWLRCRYDGLTQGVAEALEPANRDKATEPWELLRLQAALAASQGAPNRALELLAQAEEDLSQRPASGFNLTDLEDLRAYRAALARV